ncbi:MAG: alpha-L-rhamnosidase C-terminal domain-containing protein [Eubacteriales bacterium]|jgi:alpha-L-rhamnosidase|nr:alpha-L-rhamnosidase C-terminal domain-containing protein [Eubacteriales bacterium]
MSKVSDVFPSLAGYNADPRTRRYLAPKRIMWTRGSVSNPEALLEEKSSQITLDAGNACVLENKPGQPKAAILLDYGIEINGSARLMIWHVRGEGNRANLRVRFGESAMEAMTDIGTKNTTNDHANRDMRINVGFLSANETNETGYRFIRIDFEDDDARVEFKAVEGVFIFRDIEYKGSFECDDPLINKIWATAAYTAHLNMQEYLWDGIKRDRLVWIGDMQTEVMTIASVFGYNDVVPKSLDLVRDETPSGRWMNGISSYSVWWLFLHYDWYMYFGNIDYLTEQREYMLALIDILCGCVNDEGSEMLPEGRFIDWPNQANKQATHAGLHAMLKMAMEKGEFFADLFGDSALVQRCRNTAQKLSGYLPDPNGSKQAGALLVVAGLADAVKMNDGLLSVGCAKGFSTFLGYYTLAAMAMAGDYSGALDALREYWGGMLKLGATTFWEDFNLEWTENAVGIDEIVPEGKADIHGDRGAYCYEKFRHSLCHGWASGPVPFLTRYILGINVLEPACRKISIKPNLGSLNYARGTFPTPYGIIEVSAIKRNGEVILDVKSPAQVEIIK